MHENIIITQVEPDLVIIQPAFLHDACFPLLRPSRRINMSDRILYAGIQYAARIVPEGIRHIRMFRHVPAEDEANLAVGLLLPHIHNASPEGVEDEALCRVLALNDTIRVFPRRDADPSNLRVGQQRLAHTLARIVDGDGIGLILRYAVFSSCAKREDVPVKQIDFNPAILRVLKNPLPMCDLLFDGDPFDEFQRARFVQIQILQLVLIVRLHIDADAIDIVQRHLRILLQLDHGRIRVRTPQAQHVVPIARQIIEIGFPEFKIPNRFDILLRRISRIVIRRGACIQRNIEFNTALRHKRRALLILNRKT